MPRMSLLLVEELLLLLLSLLLLPVPSTVMPVRPICHRSRWPQDCAIVPPGIRELKRVMVQIRLGRGFEGFFSGHRTVV